MTLRPRCYIISNLGSVVCNTEHLWNAFLIRNILRSHAPLFYVNNHIMLILILRISLYYESKRYALRHPLPTYWSFVHHQLKHNSTTNMSNMLPNIHLWYTLLWEMYFIVWQIIISIITELWTRIVWHIIHTRLSLYHYTSMFEIWSKVWSFSANHYYQLKSLIYTAMVHPGLI